MIAAAMPRPSAASPLGSFFAALSSRFGGDAEPLAEESIARLVEQARDGDTGARRTLYVQYVDRVFRAVRGMLRSDAELNASDIGAAVGIEPATIRKILERARTRLGARIETLSSPAGGLS